MSKESNFTLDEKEALASMVDSSSWAVFKKVLVGIDAAKAREVLNFDLSRGADLLLLEKARGEGCSWTIAQIVNFMEKEFKGKEQTDGE